MPLDKLSTEDLLATLRGALEASQAGLDPKEFLYLSVRILTQGGTIWGSGRGAPKPRRGGFHPITHTQPPEDSG